MEKPPIDIRFRVSGPAADRLRLAVLEHKKAPNNLIRQIVETVLTDNLIKAVLDE